MTKIEYKNGEFYIGDDLVEALLYLKKLNRIQNILQVMNTNEYIEKIRDKEKQDMFVSKLYNRIDTISVLIKHISRLIDLMCSTGNYYNIFMHEIDYSNIKFEDIDNDFNNICRNISDFQDKIINK